ncbi:MAG: hypothetical protein INF43_05645 [Alphaproteobacteria bacterium]|jgi:hypothetical protein|nr:hypothetical protein [Alphaproteobacteria bacterium]
MTPTPDPYAPQPTQPCGRLILILETALAPTSRAALQAKLQLWHQQPEPTFVASLAHPARAAALRADAGKVFYNTTDDLTLDETVALLPWREVWLLANGRFWQGLPPR